MHATCEHRATASAPLLKAVDAPLIVVARNGHHIIVAGRTVLPPHGRKGRAGALAKAIAFTEDLHAQAQSAATTGPAFRSSIPTTHPSVPGAWDGLVLSCLRR